MYRKIAPAISACIVIGLLGGLSAQEEKPAQPAGSTTADSTTADSTTAGSTTADSTTADSTTADSTTADSTAADSAPVEPTPVDEVQLKNGSIVKGTIVDLTGGALSIKTSFGSDDVIKIKWSEIANIKTISSHEVKLADGKAHKGKIVGIANGQVEIEPDDGTEDGGTENVSVAFDQVEAINPPDKKLVTMDADISFGGTVQDGNTQTKASNLTANLVARMESQRLTLGAVWNYAEDNVSGITARNAKATAKYDYFLTERFFAFSSVLVETDKFQDLDLRTLLAAGPGYQLAQPGDFETSWLQKFDAYAEAGVAYSIENFITSPNRKEMRLRWAFRTDLPLDDRFTLFHNHEIYPSVENTENVYLTSEQGIRLKIWKGFISTAQINWKWNNAPSPGFERSDVQYLLTLGYQVSL